MNSPDFVNFISSFDVISLCETWAEFDNEFNDKFHGFTVFGKSRPRNLTRGRFTGGICVLIKNSLVKYVRCIRSEMADCILLLFNGEIFKFDKDVLLCSVYIPPQSSTAYHRLATNNGIELMEFELIRVLSNLPDVHLIISGDLNARTAKEPDFIIDDEVKYVLDESFGYAVDSFNMSRVSKDSETNVFGRFLLALCCSFSLHILNGRSGNDAGVGDYTCITHNGASVVDYVLVPTPLFDKVTHFSIVTRVESDHLPLSFKLPCFFNKCEHMTMPSSNANTKFNKYIWSSDHVVSFLQLLSSSTSLHSIIEVPNQTTNQSINIIYDALKSAAGKCHMYKRMRSSRVTQNQPTWFDRVCNAMKAQKYKLLRTFRRSNNPLHLRDYQDARKLFKNTCREKKNRYIDEQRLNLMSSSSNSKHFWAVIRQNSPSKLQIAPTIEPDQWYTYFSSLFSQPVSREEFVYQNELTNLLECVDDFNPERELNWDILNGPISITEIVNSVQRLKNEKSPGPDELIGEFFKFSIDVLLPYLHIIFNRIFDSGEFPRDWSKGIIVPIFKKGDINNPGNYRAISLLSVFSKIFTAILNNRLTTWADALGEIDEAQAGFRRGYSTVDNIFILQSIVQKYITKNRRKLYCGFVDFSKAFDTVERQQLWYVLVWENV